MSDDNKIITPSMYPSNSNKNKKKCEEDKTKIEPRVEKLTTGKVVVKKKTVGDKFKDTFVATDSKEVTKYVFRDVIVPTVKELLVDIINKGTNMLIFGDTRTTPRRSRIASNRARPSRINYGSYSSYDNGPRERRREIDYKTRATHDFDTLEYSTKWEAENVRDKLVELTYQYGQATVADLYDASGITSEYTDRSYGWTELGSAKIRRSENGYIILLPRPTLLTGS